MNIKGTDFNVNFFTNIRSGSVQENPGDKSEIGFSALLRGKADSIEISKRPDESSEFLRHTKGNILSGICRDTDPNRLSSLKTSIASGEYSVDSDEMARLLTE